MAEKVIIIGSGCAGLSAAIYTSREGFKPLLIGGSLPGGQLSLTTEVENYPGFEDGVQGPELINKMRAQAEKFGTRFLDEDVTEVDFKSRPFKVTAAGTTYETDSVIIATGANAMLLGLDNEQKFMGRGVSTCATCDGAFFKNKNVIVVGGGDTAMEDSTFLTRFATSVTIVHRRDAFRASKVMQERALKNPKIKVMWDTVVVDIGGDKKVASVKLKNVKTGDVKEMPIDGIFIAIGYSPNTGIFKGHLKLDEKGYLVVEDEVMTGVTGVYVAGDVADHFYRQAVVAAGAGVKAALQAREYLSKLEFERSKAKK